MADCGISGGKKHKKIHKKRTYKKHKSVKKHGGSAGFLNKLAVPATLLIARTSLMGPPRVNSSNKTKRRRRKTRSRK